ncbi:hypothetical protein QTP88_028406 [Uroleucon formosanum]
MRNEYRIHLRLQRPATFGDLRRITGILEYTPDEPPPPPQPKPENKKFGSANTQRPSQKKQTRDGAAEKPLPSNPCSGRVGRTKLIEHDILLKNQTPIALKPYPYSQVKQSTIDTIIRDMKEQGLVEQSTYPWAAPIVLAKKKDGSPRLCIDYRRLNDITEYDAYPMPDLNTLIRQMRGAKVYSVLDLKSGPTASTQTPRVLPQTCDNHSTPNTPSPSIKPQFHLAYVISAVTVADHQMERQQPTTRSTLQQAAELLERSQQLVRSVSLEEGTRTTTAARVRQMTTAQLQWDPVLWAAYTRGWEDRTVVFQRATSGGSTTAVRHNRSRSPRRVTQPTADTRPAATARPAANPQTAPPLPTTRAPQRPPPRPLMERPIPAPRLLTIQPPGTAANPLSTPNTTAETTTPATLNARQAPEQAADAGLQGQTPADVPATPPGKTGTNTNPHPETTPNPSQPGPATSDLAMATVLEVTNTTGITGTTLWLP